MTHIFKIGTSGVLFYWVYLLDKPRVYMFWGILPSKSTYMHIYIQVMHTQLLCAIIDYALGILAFSHIHGHEQFDRNKVAIGAGVGWSLNLSSPILCLLDHTSSPLLPKDVGVYFTFFENTFVSLPAYTTTRDIYSQAIFPDPR